MLHYERHCFLKKQDFVGILQTKKYYGQNWLSGFCRMVRRIVDVSPIVWPFPICFNQYRNPLNLSYVKGVPTGSKLSPRLQMTIPHESLLVKNSPTNRHRNRPTHPKRYAYLKLRLCFFFIRDQSILIDIFGLRNDMFFRDFCS